MGNTPNQSEQQRISNQFIKREPILDNRNQENNRSSINAMENSQKGALRGKGRRNNSVIDIKEMKLFLGLNLNNTSESSCCTQPVSPNLQSNQIESDEIENQKDCALQDFILISHSKNPINNDDLNKIQENSLDRILNHYTLLQNMKKLNLQQINFGTFLAGSNIIMKEFEISNISGENLILRLQVSCQDEDQEIKGLSDYIYLLGSQVMGGDFQVEDTVLLAANSQIQCSVAMKPPKILSADLKKLDGQISIQLFNFESRLTLSLQSRLTNPKIDCQKLLYIEELGIQAIKLAFLDHKNIKTQILFTNQTKTSINLEISFINPQGQNRTICSCLPNQLTVPAKENFVIKISTQAIVYHNSNPTVPPENKFQTKLLLFCVDKIYKLYFPVIIEKSQANLTAIVN